MPATPLLSPYAEAVRAARKEIVTRALRAHGGDRSAPARALGMERSYLSRLIRVYDIAIPAPYWPGVTTR